MGFPIPSMLERNSAAFLGLTVVLAFITVF